MHQVPDIRLKYFSGTKRGQRGREGDALSLLLNHPTISICLQSPVARGSCASSGPPAITSPMGGSSGCQGGGRWKLCKEYAYCKFPFDPGASGLNRSLLNMTACSPLAVISLQPHSWRLHPQAPAAREPAPLHPPLCANLGKPSSQHSLPCSQPQRLQHLTWAQLPAPLFHLLLLQSRR